MITSWSRSYLSWIQERLRTRGKGNVGPSSYFLSPDWIRNSQKETFAFSIMYVNGRVQGTRASQSTKSTSLYLMWSMDSPQTTMHTKGVSARLRQLPPSLQPVTIQDPSRKFTPKATLNRITLGLEVSEALCHPLQTPRLGVFTVLYIHVSFSNKTQARLRKATP